MKKMSSIIQIVTMLIFLFTSCSKLSNCSSEEIGEIPLSERAEQFVTYPGKQKVYYENQDGDELIFDLSSHTEAGSRIQLNKIGEGNDLIYGEYSCYEYYKTYSKSDHLRTSDVKYHMYTTVTNETTDINTSNERVIFSLQYDGTKTRGVAGRYYFESDIFENIPSANFMMTKLDTLELNGKTFTEVLSSKGDSAVVYLKEGRGIIGFSVDENDWVLK